MNHPSSTILSAILCLALAAPVIAATAKKEDREGRLPRIARAHDAQKREYWGLTDGRQRKPAPEPPPFRPLASKNEPRNISPVC